ncbi:hypothetical protein TNCV_621671 [Trichonephila clavipes]|nr:hypothetical protein TNCV_621671 [Trichonephila clavipes]
MSTKFQVCRPNSSKTGNFVFFAPLTLLGSCSVQVCMPNRSGDLVMSQCACLFYAKTQGTSPHRGGGQDSRGLKDYAVLWFCNPFFLLCFVPENRQNQKEHDTRMVQIDDPQSDVPLMEGARGQIRRVRSMKRTSGCNGYVNKQNCRIWSEANPQVYVETPLHPEKLTVWCALWAGEILLQKR